MAYTSRLLDAIPGIRHAFLDVHETAAFPYAELAPVKLVHGNEVHHYQQPLPTRPHADAVFTAVAGQKVGVVTADCLPLLIASRDGRFVCSVHAGWQGWPAALSTIVWPVFASRGGIGRSGHRRGAAYSPLLLRSLRRILSATAGPARR
jgi:hypothetical protein